ncbi:DUF3592 domain-containing protein [Streptomyces mauvecolor]|uniref:DUF3592 domain-containing protein n=1 Tax=Streptomyces mauvecolor TaxID=58345 RepID=A0ABV9UHA6_9ACTN
MTFSFASLEGGITAVGVIIVIGIGLLVPLPFFYAFVMVPRSRARILKQRGVTVTGECVRISWDENASISTIKYVTKDGRRSTHRTRPNYSMPIEPGDEVEVVYDPLHSDRAQLKGWLDGEPGQKFTTRAMLILEGFFLIPQLLWVYVIFYNIF